MQQVQAQRTQHSSSEDIMVTRELEVAARIRSESDSFTIRQMASIHRMSIPYLRLFAERHGITFASTDSSVTMRLSSALVDRERRHVSAVAERSLVRKPVISLDSDKITPALRERARRRDEESVNSFVSHLRELSMTHTRKEARQKVGISPLFLRTLAYDNEIVFVDEATAVSNANDPKTRERLHSTLFKPSKKIKPGTARLIRNFVISDVPDVL